MRSELDRATQGIEAFFVRQVMKEALPELGGDPQFASMLQDALAEEMAQQGGFGVARSMAAQLDPTAGAGAATSHAPTSHALRAYGVSSSFGVRRDPIDGHHAAHHGVDLPAPIGQGVRAAFDGTIVRADQDAGGYGQLVVVDHGNGLETRYAHLSAIEVSVGQSVRQGEAVGAVGSSGRSTGPHLHFELRQGGQPLDPTTHIDPRVVLEPTGEPR